MNHTILLDTIKALGADEISVCWFRSYLTGRVQVTDVDGTMSEAKGITCGVPQGSIFGTLLFLLYVNDLSGAVTCKLLLYIDYSDLLVSGKEIAGREAVLNSELESVIEWSTENRVSPH